MSDVTRSGHQPTANNTPNTAAKLQVTPDGGLRLVTDAGVLGKTSNDRSSQQPQQQFFATRTADGKWNLLMAPASDPSRLFLVQPSGGQCFQVAASQSGETATINLSTSSSKNSHSDLQVASVQSGGDAKGFNSDSGTGSQRQKSVAIPVAQLRSFTSGNSLISTGISSQSPISKILVSPKSSSTRIISSNTRHAKQASFQNKKCSMHLKTQSSASRRKLRSSSLRDAKCTNSDTRSLNSDSKLINSNARSTIPDTKAIRSEAKSPDSLEKSSDSDLTILAPETNISLSAETVPSSKLPSSNDSINSDDPQSRFPNVASDVTDIISHDSVIAASSSSDVTGDAESEVADTTKKLLKGKLNDKKKAFVNVENLLPDRLAVDKIHEILLNDRLAVCKNNEDMVDTNTGFTLISKNGEFKPGTNFSNNDQQTTSVSDRPSAKQSEIVSEFISKEAFVENKCPDSDVNSANTSVTVSVATVHGTEKSRVAATQLALEIFSKDELDIATSQHKTPVTSVEHSRTADIDPADHELANSKSVIMSSAKTQEAEVSKEMDKSLDENGCISEHSESGLNEKVDVEDNNKMSTNTSDAPQQVNLLQKGEGVDSNVHDTISHSINVMEGQVELSEQAKPSKQNTRSSNCSQEKQPQKIHHSTTEIVSSLPGERQREKVDIKRTKVASNANSEQQAQKSSSKRTKVASDEKIHTVTSASTDIENSDYSAKKSISNPEIATLNNSISSLQSCIPAISSAISINDSDSTIDGFDEPSAVAQKDSSFPLDLIELCGSSFVVLEQLNNRDIAFLCRKFRNARLRSRCSNYCRQRTLDYLCKLGLIKCQSNHCPGMVYADGDTANDHKTKHQKTYPVISVGSDHVHSKKKNKKQTAHALETDSEEDDFIIRKKKRKKMPVIESDEESTDTSSSVEGSGSLQKRKTKRKKTNNNKEEELVSTENSKGTASVSEKSDKRNVRKRMKRSEFRALTAKTIDISSDMNKPGASINSDFNSLKSVMQAKILKNQTLLPASMPQFGGLMQWTERGPGAGNYVLRFVSPTGAVLQPNPASLAQAPMFFSATRTTAPANPAASNTLKQATRDSLTKAINSSLGVTPARVMLAPSNSQPVQIRPALHTATIARPVLPQSSCPVINVVSRPAVSSTSLDIPPILRTISTSTIGGLSPRPSVSDTMVSSLQQPGNLTVRTSATGRVTMVSAGGTQSGNINSGGSKVTINVGPLASGGLVGKRFILMQIGDKKVLVPASSVTTATAVPAGVIAKSTTTPNPITVSVSPAGLTSSARTGTAVPPNIQPSQAWTGSSSLVNRDRVILLPVSTSSSCGTTRLSVLPVSLASGRTVTSLLNSSSVTNAVQFKTPAPPVKRAPTMTEAERRAKRARLEKKYPLPPGVVIKTEPETFGYGDERPKTVTSIMNSGTNTVGSGTAGSKTFRAVSGPATYLVMPGQPPRLIRQGNTDIASTTARSNADEPPILTPIVTTACTARTTATVTTSNFITCQPATPADTIVSSSSSLLSSPAVANSSPVNDTSSQVIVLSPSPSPPPLAIDKDQPSTDTPLSVRMLATSSPELSSSPSSAVTNADSLSPSPVSSSPTPPVIHTTSAMASLGAMLMRQAADSPNSLPKVDARSLQSERIKRLKETLAKQMEKLEDVRRQRALEAIQRQILGDDL